MFATLKADGQIVCLIKPQFELDREDISKGGIVKDPALHQRAVDKIKKFVTEELNHQWIECIDSPIKGTEGNKEFLAWLRP